MGILGSNRRKKSEKPNSIKVVEKEIKAELKKEDTKIDTELETNSEIKSHENKIIKECHVKGSGSFIPEEITDTLRKTTVRIEINKGQKFFTGFFMKIDLKGEKINFLVTCQHSISQGEIDSKQKIDIYSGKAGNEKKTEIVLDAQKRLIKTDENLDITLIQILKEDKIEEKRYLYPDLNYKNNGFQIYYNYQVFAAGYPNVEVFKKERHIS